MRLFEEMEMPILHILAQIERTGIAIDKRALVKLHEHFSAEEAKATRGAYEAVGHEFNVASPKQLQSVLFEELKLPKTKKIKTGYSTDADSLEWLFATLDLQNYSQALTIQKPRLAVHHLLTELVLRQTAHAQ